MDEHRAPKSGGSSSYRLVALLVVFIAAALLALAAKLLPGRISHLRWRTRGTAGAGRPRT